jgi:predicted kinase
LPLFKAKILDRLNVLKRIILLIGVPGSGKSTLAAKLVVKGFKRMCADDIRGEIYGDPIIQGDPKEVYKIFFERLDIELAAGQNLVIDNTNLNTKQRSPILEKAQAASYDDIQLWLLDTPLPTCIKRNSERSRVVPDTVIESAYAELQRAGRPKKSEGKVMVIKPAAENNEFLFFPQN